MTSINPVVVSAPPFVDLYISGLPAATVRVEVTRTWRGVAQRVRGDSQSPVLGTSARVVDWSLPVALAPTALPPELVDYVVSYEGDGMYSVAAPPGVGEVVVSSDGEGVYTISNSAGDPVEIVQDSEGVVTQIGQWVQPEVEYPMVTYTVTPIGADGAPAGVVGVTEVVAPSVGHSEVWLSDPHDPIGAVRVVLLRADGGEVADSAAQAIRTMTGLPVGIDGPRNVRSRPWVLRSESDAVTAAVDRIIASGGFGGYDGPSTLLLRGDASCLDHPTGVVHVQAQSVSRHRTVGHQPRVTWSWSGPGTRGPKAPPVVSRRTYQDDLDENPTYQDSLDAYPTYLDRIRAGL